MDTARVTLSGVPNAPRAAGLRAQEELEALLLARPTTAIQNHLLAFVDIPESQRRQRLVVTPDSTGEMLRALGVASWLGAKLLTRRASQVQKTTGGTVELDRIQEAIRDADRGSEAHSGTFQKGDRGELRSGELNPELAADFWLRLTRGRRYLTARNIDDHVRGELVLDLGLVRLHRLGRLLSRLEFQLLFDVAAQISTAGERVLTEDRFLAFLDGSLWRDLAQARSACRPYAAAPLRHEACLVLAERIRRIAARQPGAAPAPVAVDPVRSLAEQQRSKTIVLILLRPLLDLLQWASAKSR